MENGDTIKFLLYKTLKRMLYSLNDDIKYLRLSRDNLIVQKRHLVTIRPPFVISKMYDIKISLFKFEIDRYLLLL